MTRILYLFSIDDRLIDNCVDWTKRDVPSIINGVFVRWARHVLPNLWEDSFPFWFRLARLRLIQVKISGTGLSTRGTKVTLHDHFDGARVLRWENRKYTYKTFTKAQRKIAAEDDKSINARVEEAVTKCCTKNSKGHKPAVGHPWKKMHIGKFATDSKTVIQ